MLSPIFFIEKDDLKQKDQFYIPWPSVGRSVDDGIHDPLNYEDLSTIDKSIIGVNGIFLSRCDQKTVIINSTNPITIKYRINDNVSEVPIKEHQNAIVPEGIEFSIIAENLENIQILNRKTLAVGKSIFGKSGNRLDSSFSSQNISLVDAKDTGAILTDCRKVEYNTFPGATINKNNVGILENNFNMEWQDIDGVKQVHFEGTGGVLAGGQGNPGVFLISDNEINVNLLLKRIDGSFYLDASDNFLMVVAKSLENGDPDVNSLKAAIFPKDGVLLPIGFWHSVPIPLPGNTKLVLNEIVAMTNANTVINVAEETGGPLRVTL